VDVDARMDSSSATNPDAQVRGDGGLPPFCVTGPGPGAARFALCEDFESGAWVSTWTPETASGGSLSVTALTHPVARALAPVAQSGMKAMLRHPVDVSKNATLTFALRVDAITSEATVLHLDLRKDTSDELVLTPYPGLPRAVAYLVHREGPGAPVRTAIANFTLGRYVQITSTLPSLGASQPLHVLVDNDLRATSLTNPEAATAPSFAIGVRDAQDAPTVYVDNLTLEYP
jgi:hypothetical protein